MRVPYLLVVLFVISLPGKTVGNASFSEPQDSKLFFSAVFVLDNVFVLDSVFVSISGTILSGLLEQACLKSNLPVAQQAAYCQVIATEGAALLLLLKLQWPVEPFEIWEYLNLALLLAAGYLSNPNSASQAVLNTAGLGVYNLITKASIKAITYQITEHSGDMSYALEKKVALNGLCTGLLLSNLLLLLRQNGARAPVKFWVRTLATSTIALSSSAIYIYKHPPAKDIIAASSSTLFDTLCTAVIGSILLPKSPDILLEVVIAGGSVAITNLNQLDMVSGALTGVLIAKIIIKASSIAMDISLKYHSSSTILTSLTKLSFGGLPLLVSVWIASFSQAMKTNMSLHDTMQGVCIHPVTAYETFRGWIHVIYDQLTD